jgi:N-acetylmuramoyl-L-alanine amidase
VHVYCEEPLSYRADASEPGYVVLKIYGGVVDPRSVGRSGRLGLVEHVESRQLRDHALVYVKVDELVDRYRTYTSEDGREIVLVVEEEQISALPSPTPRGRVNVMVEEAPVDVTRPIDVRTVVIDPGHGGVEVGRVGRSGVLEKDVNLAVARELQRYLQREGGLEVVLTREKDEQLSLAERAEIANRAGGDLFISLHCNGWFNEGATGIETYFLSPAKTDWTQQVAAEENRGLEDEGDDVSFIVWELVQNKFISASSDLAETVQATLCRELSGVNRGVRQAGFRVLVGAYMPAVLVEMGFLSNSSEEQRLDDGRYQRQLAKALGQAVLEFKERYARSAHLAGSDEE